MPPQTRAAATIRRGKARNISDSSSRLFARGGEESRFCWREELLRFAVFSGEVERNFSAGALLGGVDDASVERTGIHVNADGALVEFSRIENAMHGLERIDGAGMRDVHLDDFGGLDGAFAAGNILMDNVEILHQQTAGGDGHPAILVAVVVDGAGLADLPTDGHQFVKRSFVDEVAGVVLAIPDEIGSEGIGIQRCVLQELADSLGLIKSRFRKLAQLGDEILN
jgi:hypothetical protein